MFQSFVNMLMGKPGRAILAGIETNKLTFLLIFFVYASILIYSKMILHYYYPRKMKALIVEHPEVQLEADLMVLWREKKQQFGWYILVPSKNELWVKPAATSSDRHQLLFYNHKDKSQNDADKIMEIKGAEN